ncbi:alpha/beta-hydrolase [Aureobasidium pullulans]|uniref:Alpha/beta-hydrolase n=1 Tax=Aureobasidium pullulans TaxID=5580 RepID=A0A4T0BEF1_AURPU|nr:alpha/beta-hydrolase [Aureobasidium pullulans]
MATPSKYSDFDQKDVVYKTVNDQDISTTILVPRNITPGKHPLLVHFHGGFLICGSKLYEEWHATWTIQLAAQNNAILVTPNYRLLPEANGREVLDDISDFWSWVKTSLPSELVKMASGVEVDTTNTLVAGESAGGYLAIQSSLLRPSAGIKAVISQYGMLDNKIPHFTQKGQKHMAGAPQQPESEVDDYLQDMQKGAVRTETHPWEMWLFICAAVQAGRYLEFLGDGVGVHAIDNLETAERVPACWIIHGKEDSLVPIEASNNFVDKLKQTHPATPLRYTIQPGEHGFDGAVTMDEDWVKEGCAWLEKYWP